MQRAVGQIEIKPDVFINNNGVFSRNHQSPLSTILSIFASYSTSRSSSFVTG